MTSDPDLSKFSETYTDLTVTLQNLNIPDLSASEINTKLKLAVHQALHPILQTLQSTLQTSLTTTRETLLQLQALPAALQSDFDTILTELNTEELNGLSIVIRALIDAFHEAVETPASIFPRLACGDVPVDPVRVTNFRKRYAKLERMHELDPDLNFEDRSMPTVPKSGLDVITNVTTSLEGFTDDVLAASEAVMKTANILEKMRESVQEMAEGVVALVQVVDKQEAIGQSAKRVAAMFTDEEQTERDLPGGDANPLRSAQQACEFWKEMQNMGTSLQVLLTDLRQTSDNMLQLGQRLRETLTGGVAYLSRLTTKIRRLDANIPRIERELRVFFFPTGIHSLILKPAYALESIFQAVDNLKNSLLAPDENASMARAVLEKGEVVERLEGVRGKVEETGVVPGEIVRMLAREDVRKKVMDALEMEFSKLCSEIGDGVVEDGVEGVENGVENVLQAVGVNEDVANKVADVVGDKLGGLFGDGDTEKDGEETINTGWGIHKLFA